MSNGKSKAITGREDESVLKALRCDFVDINNMNDDQTNTKKEKQRIVFRLANCLFKQNRVWVMTATHSGVANTLQNPAVGFATTVPPLTPQQ
jgi:hypothetical protein